MTTLRVLHSVVHIKWMQLKRHHGLLVLVFNLFLVPPIPLTDFVLFEVRE